MKAPTPGQRRILAYARQQGGQFGPLGTDRRSYEACLRRGWLVEEAVERDFGLGTGVVAVLTESGATALDLPEDEADEAFEQDYPLTAAMADDRTPRQVAEHGKSRRHDSVEEWETYIEEAIAHTSEREDLVAALRATVADLRGRA